tara:strand:+ start:1719 stop:2810 length:1092 start_codon:yes stop_codon:yes gene_type:complete
MNFRNLYGQINFVPLSQYEKLISEYTEIVKKVVGVKSIIQIGSFTTPGLSDIDIIVIVEDKTPPKWEDISLLKILKGKEGFEVIVHDVFVYPFSLSKYIEGLFYLDRKKVLFGDDIGGLLSVKKIDGLKLILSFEYTIHRLETLLILVSLKKTNIRDVLLFISTLRHTYKLLSDFNIITKEECEKRVSKIELLRNSSVNNSSEALYPELIDWIVPSFEAIFNSALLLSEKLKYDSSENNKKWVLNFKKLIFEVNDTKMATKFFKKTEFLNKLFSGKVVIEPMPSTIHKHIENYNKSNYIGINKIDTLELKTMRYVLAMEHAKFIKLNKYPIAKSYIIIDEKVPKTQDLMKLYFLKMLSFFYLN